MTKIKTITVINKDTSVTEAIPSAISQIYYDNAKNDLKIVTDDEDVTSQNNGNIAIESANSVIIKPTNDLTLTSSNRSEDYQNEVSLKVVDKNEKPVKLQVNASEVVLNTKDKAGINSKTLNLSVNSDKGVYGDLKINAQSIDVSSKSAGDISIQPKGYNVEGAENKVRFQHGGGNGLEFLTMNNHFTSIFTDEYRFKEDGVVCMSTRETVTSDKYDHNDETTAYKYVEQEDGLYDIIKAPTATWGQIIKTAYTLGGNYCNTRVADIDDYEVYHASTGDIIVETLTYNMGGGREIKPNMIIHPVGLAIIQSNVLIEAGKKLITAVTSPSDTISCDWADIVKFVNWAKTHNYGPWAA